MLTVITKGDHHPVSPNKIKYYQKQSHWMIETDHLKLTNEKSNSLYDLHVTTKFSTLSIAQ